MKLKSTAMWLLLVVCCAGTLAGCKPADKKTPDEPSPNTTDSK